MEIHRAVLRCTRGTLAIASSLLIASCATGLESLPLPAPGQSGERITLTAAFVNALNLPTKAKVKLNGATIGEVESIRAQDFTAYVTMSIDADVPLPVGSTAELRSSTPLGDIFVAIRPLPDPGAAAPMLRDGDKLPLNTNTAAATVEDALSSAALLANGGAIRRLVSTVNGAGSAVGGRGEKVAALLDESNTLITRLNARSAQIDNALRSTSDLAATVSARQETLNAAIAAAVPGTSVIADNAAQLTDLAAAVARITDQLNRFPSMQGTDTRSMIADLNRLSDSFNGIATDPNLDLNSWNRLLGITMKLMSGPNIHGSVDVPQIAIGALPDMNYPGDPAFHLPDGTDWHAMIASLRYEWNLLLSRIYGPEHRPR